MNAEQQASRRLIAYRIAAIVDKFDSPKQKEELMKEKLATDIREFIQEYFDAWQEGVTEKILSYLFR